MSAEADATPNFGVRPDGRSLATRSAETQLVSDELVARARAGDEAAFVELYRAVQPRLLRYLRVLVSDDAEDAAAETWLQVCRDLARFSGGGAGFLAWMIRMGRNRAIDQARHRNRRPAVPVPAEQLTPIAGADDTEGQALARISTSAAVALIASLPADQAEAVMLRAVLGLDAKAAGNVLGKRPGAVRTAAHRGLRALSDQVGEHQ